MLCLIIPRKYHENIANLTFCRQDVEHSPFTVGNRGEMQRRETFHCRYFYGKRSHFYGKWSVNPLVTLVFMYLTQKDVLPDSKKEKL